MVIRRPDGDDPRACDAADMTVDLLALSRATGGDPALQREVVRMLVEQAAEKLELIRQSLVERDADTLRRACHTLLGSCSTLGAVKMAELLSLLEEAALAGDFETGSRVCADLSAVARRSLALLEESVLALR